MPRDLSKELEDIGRQIVSKCRGLPLSVKSMAGLLRNSTDVAKWQDVLESSMWELEDKDQTLDIIPALKVRYDYLPSRLKQCFYYCSIFPKGHVFVKEDLVKLWIAQGFVVDSRRKSAEENGIEYFRDLLARFFFETTKMKSLERYRMHDNIHELAQSISIHHCCQVEDFNGGDHRKNIGCASETRHVSVLDPDAEEPALMVARTCEKARTLLFLTRHVSVLDQEVEDPALIVAAVDTREKARTVLFPTGDPKKFEEALSCSTGPCSVSDRRPEEIWGSSPENLWFFETPSKCSTGPWRLDLSSSVLLELPSAIEELKLLRCLDLSRTEIKVLPDLICNLYNLQVLKLLGCVWHFRPPADFSYLVNLCYLELDRMFWVKCSVLPPGIGKVSNLRNWHAFHVGREDGYRISELGNMASLMGILHISRLENTVNAVDANLEMKKDLQKLVFEWSIEKDVSPNIEVVEETVLEGLIPHQNISELQIDNCAGGRIPTWMTGEHLQNLVRLSLNRCTIVRILVELFIKGLQEVEELSEKGGFSSLLWLKISHCPRLRMLPEAFPCLKVLKIKKCDSLQALPTAPSLYFLILIDNLALEDWKEGICHITLQDDQGQQVGHQTWPSFIKLIELKFKSCPNLRDLSEHFAPQKLEIHRCEGIKSLLPPQFARRFQHLALDGCVDDTLVKAIPRTNSLYSLVISNLTCFPNWPELPGLKALYISNCQDLLGLPESGTEGSLQRLTSLKLLSIRGCPKLTTLPVEGLPTNLECLIIASCSALESLGGPQTIRSLASLKDLYIENCPLLESFPEDGLRENLKHLCIKGYPLLLKHCQDRNIITNCDLEIERIEPPSTYDNKQTLRMSSPCHQVFLRCLGV